MKSESGVPEGTVFQEEVIGQTEDGQDIYGGYVEAPEDTDVPLMDDVNWKRGADGIFDPGDLQSESFGIYRRI